MADADKNIVITPNRSGATEPTIVFTGKGNVPLTLKVNDDTDGTITIEGSSGVLFSINNNVSYGVIFAINNQYGVSAFDVDADGAIRLAPYSGVVYSNTLYAVPKTTAGAGNNVTIQAGDGVTSGAGGSIILKPGTQAVTGGDGTVTIEGPTASTAFLKMRGGSSSRYHLWSNNSDAATLQLGRSDHSSWPLSFQVNNGNSKIFVTNSTIANTGANLLFIQAGEGSAQVIKMNCRTDSDAAIGGLVQFFTRTGQTDNAIEVVRPGGTPNILAVSANGYLTVAPTALTGTQSPSVTVTGPAHTALTASTESNDIYLNLARTVQFSTGALTLQRAIRVAAPTYSAVAASTITTAATMQIDSAPVAGTNATITNQIALRVLTGVAAAKGIVVQGATSQTGYALEVQNSSAATKFYVTDAGMMGIGGTTTNDTLNVYDATYPYIRLTNAANTSGLRIGVEASLYALIGVYEANRPLVFTTSGTSSGAAFQRMRITHDGLVGINSTGPGAQLQIETNAAATKGLIVKGAASQSANLQEWQNSSGTPLLQISSTGDIYKNGGAADLYISTGNGYGIVYQADNNGHRFQVWSSSWVDRMVILENGNVGIGTSSPSSLLHLSQPTQSGNVASSFTVTGAGHTALTASTEYHDVYFNLARTVQFATGALTLQRAIRVAAPTYSAVAASTITTAATMQIDSAPVAGTNATITNQIALRVLTGVAAAKGIVIQGASSQTGNFLEAQNNSGTALARIASNGSIYGSGGSLYTSTSAASGGFIGVSKWLGMDGTYINIRKLYGYRDWPGTNANGDYVEIATISRQQVQPVTLTIHAGHGSINGSTGKVYIIQSNYSAGSFTAAPISGGTAGDFDFDIEVIPIDAYSSTIRARRTSSVTPTYASFMFSIECHNYNRGGMIEASGTGNSASPVPYMSSYQRIGPYVSAPTPVGGSGAGTHLTMVASAGAGTGNGGTMYLSGGSYATSGTHGNVTVYAKDTNSDGTFKPGFEVAGVSMSANAHRAMLHTHLTWNNGTALGNYHQTTFYRLLPTTVGDYVELFKHGWGAGIPLRVTIVTDRGSWAAGTIAKTYYLHTETSSSGVIAPTYMKQHDSSNDYVFERVFNTGVDVTYRLRRTNYSVAVSAYVLVESFSPYQIPLTPLTGTGTSAVGSTYIDEGFRAVSIRPPDTVGNSGAGNSLYLYGNPGVTSGAGGSVIVQPGAQATTGGDGSVILRAASATASLPLRVQNSSSTDVTTVSNSGFIVTAANSASALSTYSIAKTVLGGIHLANGSGTSSTNRNEAAITFQGSSATEAQAGIYVLNDNITGTHMALATTDNYTTGPQLAVTISSAGVVNFPRAVPTYNGTAIAYGAGTGSCIPKFLSASSNIGDSRIYDNGANVGIGISSPTGFLHVSQSALTGTPAPSFIVTGPAHTLLTASTEYHDVYFNLARTVQFVTGGITLQRAIRIAAPTYSAVAASTITTAATMQIDGAPNQGTNVTLTETIALRITTGITSGKGLVIQASGGQTGNLQEWQASGGTVIGKVTGTGAFDLAPTSVSATTAVPALKITGAGHSNLTASTEYNHVHFALSPSVQFAAGSLSMLRAVRIASPTYAAVSASTCAMAATVSIDGAPVASTNMTLTESVALYVATVGAERKGIIIQQGLSQTGNLFEVKNDVLSGSNTLMKIAPGGKVVSDVGFECAVDTTATGPFTVGVFQSGSATSATKGTGHGRDLIVKAGDSDNSSGKTGGDLYLRPGAPTSPSTQYGDVYIGDTGGYVQLANFTATTSSPSAYAADQNDLVLTAAYAQRLSASGASRNITGIAPFTGALNSAHKMGRIIEIINVGTQNLVLKHNSTSSVAANRIYSSTAADVTLTPNQSVRLFYDGTNNGSGAAGWRVLL